MNLRGSVVVVRRIWNTSWFAPAVVALLLSLAILSERDRDPTFYNPVVDAGRNHREATLIASHMPPPASPYWQPPLYPLVLGAVYTVTGKSIMAAKVFQAILGAVTCALLALVGERLFGRTVGRIGGLILAASGPFLFYNLQLLAAGLSVMLDVLTIHLALRALERPTLGRWAIAGLAAGLAAVAFPSFLLFTAALALWLLWVHGVREKKWKAAFSRAGALLAAVILVIAPVTIRNYVVSGDLVPISYNGGYNLYLGNNPHWVLTVAARPGFQSEHLLSYPALEGIHRAEASDRWFRQRAWEFIRSHPGSFLQGLAAKTELYLSGREVPRNEDPYEYRDYSRVLRVLMWQWGPFGFPFGLILPFAVLGILAGGVSTAPRRVLLAFTILNSIAVIVFFVSSRHRLPAAAALGIFAAYGAVWLAKMIRQRRLRPAIAGAACVILIAVIANRSVPAPTDHVNFRAETTSFLAADAFMAGRYHAAEDLFRRSIAMDSTVAETHTRLGALYGMVRRPDLAIIEYRKAIRLDPGIAEAHLNLGALLGNQGEMDSAIVSFRRAVAAWPACVPAHYSLGDAYALRDDGHWIEEYQTAWRLEHGAGRPAPDPGEILIERGQSTPAVTYFRSRLMKEPSDLQAEIHLSLALSRQAFAKGLDSHVEDLNEAVALAQAVARVEPGRADAHWAMAIALAGLHRRNEALAEYVEAIRIDPRGARLRVDHARLLIEMKDEKNGEEELREAIELDPLMTDAYQQLASLLLSRGDGAGAAEIIRRAALARSSASSVVN